MVKPPFTEIEIEELCDLYGDTHYSFAIGDVMNFLEKLGYSKVDSLMIELRKEFVNKRCPGKHNKREENYPNSSLQDKLYKRLDYIENVKTPNNE